MTEAALSLERYAEATAHLVHFKKADPSEVIERLGLDRSDYESAQKTWTAAIGDDLSRQEVELSLRFGEVFFAAKQRLDETKPPLSSIGPRAAAPGEAQPAPAENVAAPAATEAANGLIAADSEPVAVPPVPAPPTPTLPSHLEVPSFLQQPPSPGGVPEPRVVLSPPLATPPRVAAPPPISISHVPPGLTGQVDVGALLKKAVPFSPGATPTGGASPTTTQAPSTDASRASPASPDASSTTRTPRMGETTDVDIAALARQVLAFGSPGAKKPTAATPPAPVASPPPASPARPAPSPSLPASPAARPLPALTVEQYALLSAEITLTPDTAAHPAIFARFGVHDPAALTAAWRARFAADPALAIRWRTAYAESHGRLSRGDTGSGGSR